jgi:hypothetical protein
MGFQAWLLAAAASLPGPQEARVPVVLPPQRSGLPPTSDAVFRMRMLETERSWIDVEAYVHPLSNSLKLGWSHCPDGSRNRYRTSTSSHGFPGTPTALVPFGDRTLLVAGVAQDGHTIIERIGFGVPDVDPRTQVLIPGKPTAWERIYRSPEPGRPVIARFCGLPGKRGREVAALTWDSSEVLAFDPQTGSFRRLVVPIPCGEAGVLVVPELSRTYHSISSRDHRERGHMLWLGTAQYDFIGDDDRTLVLIDRDRDGVFDRSLLLDSEGWAREDLSNSKHYVR